MYDEGEIRARISKKRQRFIVYLVIAIAILSCGVALIISYPTDTLFFIGIIISLAPLVYISMLINSYSPRILFSGKVMGENVKEDVYEVYVRRGVALRPNQVGMGYGGQPLSHTRMARATLRSAVYLRLQNGEIKEIRGMRVEHIELYRDGDVLLKYRGTKYPVIINRKTERQPCPICGTINLVTDEECLGCNLSIKN